MQAVVKWGKAPAGAPGEGAGAGEVVRGVGGCRPAWCRGGEGRLDVHRGGAAGRLRAVLLAGTPVGAFKRYSSVRANATASSTASIGVAQLVTKRATGRPFT